MIQFPFPDKITSRNELTRDVVYQKIPLEERDRICDGAWEIGVETAVKLCERHPGKDIYEIAYSYGLKFVREDVDKVSAGMRFFSEYDPKKNQIHVYVRSIQLFAENNGLLELEAEELILAHEFYHFLEANEIGKTSERYKLPWICLGPFKIGSTGVRALCEIGAHGFARTYWQRCLAQIDMQSK